MVSRRRSTERASRKANTPSARFHVASASPPSGPYSTIGSWRGTGWAFAPSSRAVGWRSGAPPLTPRQATPARRGLVVGGVDLDVVGGEALGQGCALRALCHEEVQRLLRAGDVGLEARQRLIDDLARMHRLRYEADRA